MLNISRRKVVIRIYLGDLIHADGVQPGDDHAGGIQHGMDAEGHLADRHSVDKKRESQNNADEQDDNPGIHE